MRIKMAFIGALTVFGLFYHALNEMRKIEDE